MTEYYCPFTREVFQEMCNYTSTEPKKVLDENEKTEFLTRHICIQDKCSSWKITEKESFCSRLEMVCQNLLK